MSADKAKEEVTEFLKRLDPRPPYIEEPNSRSAVAGVFGLCLVPAFLILLVFTLPASNYQPVTIACFCAPTSSNSNTWLVDITTRTLQSRTRGYSDVQTIMSLLTPYTNIPTADQINTETLPLTPQQSAQMQDVDVRMFSLTCPSVQPGEDCDSTCNARHTDWLNATATYGDPFQSVFQYKYWNYYAELSCADSLKARFCVYVPIKQTSVFGYELVAPPLCRAPRLGAILNGVGSVFGLLIGFFINTPAAVRIIYRRVAATNVQREAAYQAIGRGVRNAFLGLGYFGLLFTLMRDTSSNERIGAHLMASLIVNLLPWPSYIDLLVHPTQPYFGYVDPFLFPGSSPLFDNATLIYVVTQLVLALWLVWSVASVIRIILQRNTPASVPLPTDECCSDDGGCRCRCACATSRSWVVSTVYGVLSFGWMFGVFFAFIFAFTFVEFQSSQTSVVARQQYGVRAAGIVINLLVTGGMELFYHSNQSSSTPIRIRRARLFWWSVIWTIVYSLSVLIPLWLSSQATYGIDVYIILSGFVGSLMFTGGYVCHSVFAQLQAQRGCCRGRCLDMREGFLGMRIGAGLSLLWLCSLSPFIAFLPMLLGTVWLLMSAAVDYQMNSEQTNLASGDTADGDNANAASSPSPPSLVSSASMPMSAMDGKASPSDASAPHPPSSDYHLLQS